MQTVPPDYTAATPATGSPLLSVLLTRTPLPTRRQAAALLLGGLAAATLPRTARAARTITLIGYGDWFQPAFEQAVIAPFRKAHPEFDVFFYPVTNALQTLGLLRGQRVVPSIDVALMDIAIARQATLEKLLDPLTPAAMPVLSELTPAALSPAVDAPVMAWDTLVIGYSRDLVKSPPTTWHGLWDSAYTQIALPTPPDLAALAFTQAASTAFGGHGDLASLDVGLNALMTLAPRVSMWNPRPDVATAVAFGDAAIGPVWNGMGQAQALKMPTRCGIVLPGDGSPALPINVALAKDAPQAEGGRALVSWILGREAQAAITETMALAPANAAADPTQAARAKAGATPDDVARRMAIDWTIMMSIRDQLAAEWRRRHLAAQ